MPRAPVEAVRRRGCSRRRQMLPAPAGASAGTRPRARRGSTSMGHHGRAAEARARAVEARGHRATGRRAGTGATGAGIAPRRSPAPWTGRLARNRGQGPCSPLRLRPRPPPSGPCRRGGRARVHHGWCRPSRASPTRPRRQRLAGTAPMPPGPRAAGAAPTAPPREPCPRRCVCGSRRHQKLGFEP